MAFLTNYKCLILDIRGALNYTEITQKEIYNYIYLHINVEEEIEKLKFWGKNL